MDPALADFNIHPAKKEVRLRNLDEIRRGLMDAIRDYPGHRGQERIRRHPARRGGFGDAVRGADGSRFSCRIQRRAGMAAAIRFRRPVPG